MEKEIWKRVYVYYAVSSWGRFYNTRTKKFLKGYLHESNGNTYIRVGFAGHRFFAHEMVAYKFLKWPEGYNWNDRKKWVINHLDGNSLNNNYTNVEITTQSRNVLHGIELNKEPVIL